MALVTSPGTIDADYRGEIGIVVINHGQEPVSFAHGDRIAQLVIAPVLQGRLQLVTELEETRRRITSYNVCYTKLLRSQLGFVMVHHDQGAVHTIFDRIVDEIEAAGYAEIIDRFVEFIHY